MDEPGEDGRMRALLPDILARVDREYVDILGLLDGQVATHRIMLGVPELTGVDMAYLGEPAGLDQIVLQHVVNTLTNQVTGLIVPIGIGLGGKVMMTRRPMWVSDYCASNDISPHFKAPAAAEGVKAMLAVPVTHQDQLLGVLYGANREVTWFGDRSADAMQRIAVQLAGAAVVSERARHAAEVAVHEERRRLALKLHDTVGAVLFTLRAGIRRLGDETALDEEVRQRLGTIEQQAAEASEALRGSLHVLSAPPQEVALGVALREHCRAFRDRTGIPARLIVLSDLPTLPRGSITALADLTREALHNVEKHAIAQSVVVSVFCQRNGVAVTVADDGVGLDDCRRNEGLGLAAMTERMARVGGTFTMEPNEDGGVTAHGWLPR